MISLTKIAAKNFKRIREDEELSDEVPLRVSVKGGGCAGYEYVLEFGKPTNRDLYFESEGLPIVIDKKSHLVVNGLEIDWSNDLNDRGLKFNNPSAKGSCGCRTSFMYEHKEQSNDHTPSWM